MRTRRHIYCEQAAFAEGCPTTRGRVLRVPVHARAHMCACAHVRMHACLHVCMYACMHVCMYACVPAYMYACMHVCAPPRASVYSAYKSGPSHSLCGTSLACMHMQVRKVCVQVRPVALACRVAQLPYMGGRGKAELQLTAWSHRAAR